MTPLAADLAHELAAERLALPTARGTGLLIPRGLEHPSDTEIRLWLDAFDPRALRLDVILDALRDAGSPFGSPASALVVGAAGARLRSLHAEGRADAHLGPSHILVGPGGGIALLCAGLPCIRALIVPLEPRLERLRRLAPEVLLGRPASPQSDIYALAALYYELLAGVPYRNRAQWSALVAAAKAGLDPELPDALPDPRPPLLRLLRGGLSVAERDRPSEGEAFVRAVKAELVESGIALADRATLARLIEEYVPEGAPRGPEALIRPGVGPEPTPEGFEATADKTRLAPSPFSEDAPPSPAVDPTPTIRPAPPTAEPASASGWAAILGEMPESPPGEELDVSTPEAGNLAPEPGARTGLERAGLPEAEALRGPSGLPPVSGAPSWGPSEVPVSLPTPTQEKAEPRFKLPARPGLPALDAPKGGRPPTLDEATQLSPKTLGLVLGGLFVLVGALSLVAYLRGASLRDPAALDTRELSTKAPQVAPLGGRPKPSPGTPPPSRRSSAPPARPQRAPVEKPLGLVSVMSKPSGANVLIDGGYVGRTPLVLRHRLNQRRRYSIEVVAEGYEDWKRAVLPKGGSISLVVELIPSE